MYEFNCILKTDLKNLYTNPMWWAGTIGLPLLLALVISKKLGWRLPMAYLATDLTVLLLSLSYIPPVKIACSLVTVTISSFLIGKLEGRGEKAQTTA